MSIHNVARAGFWLGVALLLVLGLLPAHVAPSLPEDKLQHFAGFLALGVLGIGWVTKRSLPMVAALAILGGAIEVLQAVPAIGRDAELADWIADLAGIFTAWALVSSANRLLGDKKPLTD